MNQTTHDLITEFRENSPQTPIKQEEEPEKMEIKEIYKQPLILCSTCKGQLGYQSFIIESTKQAIMLSAMNTISVEELILDSNIYLVVSCAICDTILGIKFVKKI